jgi:hypothetical protein
MSTMTAPASSRADASLRPLPWRRMAWVTWRQHQAALLGATALLGAAAVAVWIFGLQLHQVFAAVVACQPANSAGPGLRALAGGGGRSPSWCCSRRR